MRGLQVHAKVLHMEPGSDFLCPFWQHVDMYSGAISPLWNEIQFSLVCNGYEIGQGLMNDLTLKFMRTVLQCFSSFMQSACVANEILQIGDKFYVY